MTDQHRRLRASRDRSGRADPYLPTLPSTADASRGTSNLVTTPFAGNISSDTRAGKTGWSGAATAA